MDDAIVLLTVLFLIGFPVAWLLLPSLRAWVERPKYSFLDNLKRYEKRPL